MKHIVCILALVLFVQLPSLPAQEVKKLRVAVFDPSSSGTSLDDSTKVAIRDIISSTFAKTGKYTVVERSLLDKEMKGRTVTDIEISELPGVDKVVLSVITRVGGRIMLNIKTIDPQTATVDFQRSKVVNSNDLLEAVEPLVLEMLGESSSARSSVAPGKPAPVPANTVDGQTVVLEFAGISIDKNPEAKVYVDGEFVGEGTFSEGFSVTFTEKKSGKHKVSIKGEETKGVIDSKDYKIDTRKQRKFTFECFKGKKYYELRVK